MRDEVRDEMRDEVRNEVRLTGTGPQKTVVSSMMKNLENYRYNEANEKTRQTDQCAICMEEFAEESETCELKCDSAHIFHTQCIKDWFYQ